MFNFNPEMKTVFAFTLSTLIFFQTIGIGIGDIMLFGSLIEHAQYHSENYGDNFSDFMAKHYGAQKEEHKNNQSEEEQDHKKLPFQHTSCHHILTDGVLISFEIDIAETEIIPQNRSVFYYQNLYSSLEKRSVFQPPQHA